MLMITFTTPIDSFELRVEMVLMAQNGLLIVVLYGIQYEVARLMPDGWLVDKNCYQPGQACNMLKKFDQLSIMVDS